MDLSSDEIVVVLLFGGLGLAWLLHVWFRLGCITSLACPRGPRLELGAALAVCHVLLWIVLTGFAAPEVRAGTGLQVLFLFALTVALALGSFAIAILGADFIVDGVERNNPAARLAVGSLWLAITICTMGTHIGEGDFIGTALLPQAIGLLTLLAVAAAFARFSGGLALIAIERDHIAGARFAALLLACSLSLARASAGDWVSLEATVRDFLVRLPVIAGFVVLAIWFERRRVNVVAAATTFIVLGGAAALIPK